MKPTPGARKQIWARMWYCGDDCECSEAEISLREYDAEMSLRVKSGDFWSELRVIWQSKWSSGFEYVDAQRAELRARATELGIAMTEDDDFASRDVSDEEAAILMGDKR